MKKLSKVLVVFCALIIAFGLTACGDKGEEGGSKSDTKEKEEVVSTIEGKFVLSGMQEGENEVSKEEIVAMGGANFFIQFNPDNTFVISVTEEELPGTYTLDGETVTMTMEGETDSLVAQLVGNDFIIDDEGMKMTFTKEL